MHILDILALIIMISATKQSKWIKCVLCISIMHGLEMWTFSDLHVHGVHVDAWNLLKSCVLLLFRKRTCSLLLIHCAECCNCQKNGLFCAYHMDMKTPLHFHSKLPINAVKWTRGLHMALRSRWPENSHSRNACKCGSNTTAHMNWNRLFQELAGHDARRTERQFSTRFFFH